MIVRVRVPGVIGLYNLITIKIIKDA
jgi:hypothetical protein